VNSEGEIQFLVSYKKITIELNDGKKSSPSTMAVVERRKRLHLSIQGEGAGSKEKSKQKIYVL
jgi:hypothetical protein